MRKKTNPYTYVVFNRTTRMAYYGVRYGTGCDPKDLFTTYFTSSKLVKELIKSYGVGDFDVKVRRVFSDKASAIKWELKVLRRLAVRSDRFLNMRATVDPTAAISCGYTYINDGTKTMRWLPGAVIPTGWTSGKLGPTNTGRKWINDGRRQQSILRDHPVPDGWFLGPIRRIPYYNPATLEQSTFPERADIPRGWVKGSVQRTIRGRTPAYDPSDNMVRFFNESENIPPNWIKGIPRSGMKGKIAIYNPVTGVEAIIRANEPIPDGWVRGKPSLKQRTRPTKNTKVINPETGETIVVENLSNAPPGFVHVSKGRPNSWCKKLRWYTNLLTGVSKMLDPHSVDETETMWVRGRSIKGKS